MILPAQAIRHCCRTQGAIEPFFERTVHRGMSYGLSAASYDIRIKQQVTLVPGDFKLASTIERFKVPHDIVMICHDKSSWARRGIAVQNTLFDPGWEGYATLELSNHGQQVVHIEAGDPIAQIVFHALMTPTRQPYKGKYQNQEDKPIEARAE